MSNLTWDEAIKEWKLCRECLVLKDNITEEDEKA
jgi:hypothetical protein